MSKQPHKSIQAIVREVGRYPIDAYVFVQECIGLAAERVHGELTPEQAVIVKWMATHEVAPDELESRVALGELPPDIVKALGAVGGFQLMNRHVTGQQLCWAIRDIALERWGYLARTVLERWNIHRTEDIGAIVFALVNNHWLQKQPTDRIDDFNAVFSFDEAFDKAYQIGG